jgi:hypothetical protein
MTDFSKTLFDGKPLPELEPNSDFAARIGTCSKTPKRWDKDPVKVAEGWPLPIEVNGRLYRKVRESLAFLHQRALTSIARPAKQASID